MVSSFARGGSKPADVFIPHWQGGKDVTVVKTLQDALVHGAATTPSHALPDVHSQEMDEFREPCSLQGITFIPVAVESLGSAVQWLR